MASLRSVRRQFRKELRPVIEAGETSPVEFIKMAGHLFGQQVGYEVVLRAFLAGEVSNALSQLRLDGEIESTGKCWKPVSQLQPEDVEIISVRRLKRLRGELKAQESLAHNHGRIEEATAVARMLEVISGELNRRETADEHCEDAAEQSSNAASE